MFKLKIINKPKMIKMKCNIEFPDVVLANLQDKETTPTKETQEIVPDHQYDGLSKVTVNPIPDEYIIPTGEIEITANGNYDVNNYSSAKVNVPEKVLGTKTITTNGTYNATDDNLDGYSQVSVETSGVDINDYFETTYDGSVEAINWAYKGNYIKKCPDLIIADNVTSLEQLFYGIDYTPKIICNSNVTNMRGIYYNNNSKSIDVSGLNTSKVTNMESIFYNCRNLKSLDVSNFITSNVTNMSNMFNYCNNLTSIDVRNFDTSKVTNMSGMFYYCRNLTSIDVRNFDTSKVTDMNSMFVNCNNLTSLDVSNFITSKVTDMKYMFYYLENLTSLDLSNFDTSKVTNMYYMFYNCKKLKRLDIRNFDFTNVRTYTNMFGAFPKDCLIIVKDDTAKTWITSKFTALTNVKTVAELEQ